MDDTDRPIFGNASRPSSGSAFRPSSDTALEESGILGTHRRWTNINRFEIIFLLLGILATIVTDGLTIYRVATVPNNKDPDFVYGILIIISSLFLLIFLITGIFQQRITDIVAFFLSDLMLTIYVIVHFVLRKVEAGDAKDEAKLRLVRLIFTVSFNLLFLPLSIMVIRDYQRDEFAKRIFGAFPAARWPFKIYSIFECVARINAMFSISVCFLNLYNFNEFEVYDKVLLGIGVPLAFIWLGLGVGMIRLEKRILVWFYFLISLFQPAFIIYCLYSALDHPADTSTTTPRYTPLTSSSSTFTTSTGMIFANSEMTNLISAAAPFSIDAVLESARKLPVTTLLYGCMALNTFTHVMSLVLAFVCVRNFGKGLKEKVFNSGPDKYFRQRFS